MKRKADFVTHLRFVHFALAATCLSLLVARSITVPYTLDSAREQAVDIRDHADGFLDWVQNKRRPELRAQIELLLDNRPFFITDGKVSYTVSPESLFMVRFKNFKPNDPTSYRAYFSDWDSEPDPRFETLKDFRELWNLLFDWSHALVVTDWYPGECKIESRLGAEHNFRIALGSPPAGAGILNDDRVSLSLSEHGRWELVFDDERDYSRQPLPFGTVQIPVRLERHSVDYQRDVVSELHLAWRPGIFRDSFPDLSQYVLDREVESSSFHQLAVALEGLVDNVDSDSPPLPVFGIGIPVGVLLSWGPMLLIVIQLYFLLHYRRFVRRVSSGGDVVTVPWIGIYEDRTSKLVFALSIIALPVIASIAASAGYNEDDLVVFGQTISDRSLSVPASVFAWVALALTLLIGALTYWEIRSYYGKGKLPGKGDTNGKTSSCRS